MVFNLICFNILVHWVMMFRIHPVCICLSLPMLGQDAANWCTVSPGTQCWWTFFWGHLEAVSEGTSSFPSLDRGVCCAEWLGAFCRFGGAGVSWAPHAVSFIISVYCLCVGNKVGAIKLECGHHVRFPRFPCHVGKPESSWLVPLGIFNCLSWGLWRLTEYNF